MRRDLLFAHRRHCLLFFLFMAGLLSPVAATSAEQTTELGRIEQQLAQPLGSSLSRMTAPPPVLSFHHLHEQAHQPCCCGMGVADIIYDLCCCRSKVFLQPACQDIGRYNAGPSLLAASRWLVQQAKSCGAFVRHGEWRPVTRRYRLRSGTLYNLILTFSYLAATLALKPLWYDRQDLYRNRERLSANPQLDPIVIYGHMEHATAAQRDAYDLSRHYVPDQAVAELKLQEAEAFLNRTTAAFLAASSIYPNFTEIAALDEAEGFTGPRPGIASVEACTFLGMADQLNAAQGDTIAAQLNQADDPAVAKVYDVCLTHRVPDPLDDPYFFGNWFAGPEQPLARVKLRSVARPAGEASNSTMEAYPFIEFGGQDYNVADHTRDIFQDSIIAAHKRKGYYLTALGVKFIIAVQAGNPLKLAGPPAAYRVYEKLDWVEYVLTGLLFIDPATVLYSPWKNYVRRISSYADRLPLYAEAASHHAMQCHTMATAKAQAMQGVARVRYFFAAEQRRNNGSSPWVYANLSMEADSFSEQLAGGYYPCDLAAQLELTHKSCEGLRPRVFLSDSLLYFLSIFGIWLAFRWLKAVISLLEPLVLHNGRYLGHPTTCLRTESLEQLRQSLRMSWVAPAIFWSSLLIATAVASMQV